MNLKNLLFKTVSGGHFSGKSLSTCNFYGSDISRDLLETQLAILNMHACLRKFHSLCVIHNRILNENGIASFSKTTTILVKLILVMPVTNALSERSYCPLRGIKNYLRSTMTQKRINKLMLMSVYKEDGDNQLMLLTTFTPETLTGCQKLDTFHLFRS